MFDDNWRVWIGENLMQGASVEALIGVLVSNGFDETESREEIALASPYLRVAQKLQQKLDKRDWILGIHRKLDGMLPNWGQIERRHQLSREEFFLEYYSTNRPVILTGMMEDWPALTKWTSEYLKTNYWDRTVEIQAGRNSNRRYEIEQPQHAREMLFGDFIDQIESGGVTNDIYMTANNSNRNAKTLSELWNDVVQIPEYLDGTKEQHGFLWFGPAGTVTPLHHDLTNNFMAQVRGRKLVRLIQSNELPYVYNNLHCYSEVDLGNIDYERFPLMRNAHIIDCEISPGEILFLPVGCWHYVVGLDITMTMSFTNFVFDNDFHSMYRSYGEV